jgi:hypothetical protein
MYSANVSLLSGKVRVAQQGGKQKNIEYYIASSPNSCANNLHCEN